MGNFIESYFGNNFTNATSSFQAGMNFTNLVIAVPLVATILLIIINKSRAHIDHKYIPANLFSCQFQLISLIIYTFSYIIFASVLDLNCYLSIFILGYIPFMFLAWCIYKECDYETGCRLTSEFEYINNFISTIKNKIEALGNKSNKGNILINGAWGSGKSYMVQKYLLKSIRVIYLSCTDYTDLHELNAALIKKTNNCFIRFLMMLSLSRLIAIIGKTELKEYIGFNKVIIFDEFERLVDYNKIDHMHIVSLIQYLNHEKNCICILVANEDHLNDANQFTNVREKLISHTYHYKIPFDDVIKIIQEKYQKTLNKQNSTAEHVVKLTLKKPNDNDDVFSHIYQKLESWYQIDNNIRMIEHLYIKINQLYQATLQMIDADDFYSSRYTSEVQKNELFTGLFNYVDTVIIQLYYLYLKNPYNLTATETLATFYHNNQFKGEINKLNDKYKTNNQDNKDTTTEVQKNKNIKIQYVESDSIQNLALNYFNKDTVIYESSNLKAYDRSYDLNYILTNQVFENINDNLITDYLGKEEQVIQLLSFGKYGKTLSQNIKNFMRDFIETICESEDSKSVIDYFKGINILEERFLRIDDKIELQLLDRVVTDYIDYCQYIDKKWSRERPDNIRPVSYSRVAYINALIIQSINDSTIDNLARVINEIKSITVEVLFSVIYELTCIQAVKQNKVHPFIDRIKQISSQLATNNDDTVHLLDFMYQSYTELKAAIRTDNSKNPDKEKTVQTKEAFDVCNENLIMLLTKDNYTEENLDYLFHHLSSFNDGGPLLKSILTDTSLQYLVDKINEIFDTSTLKQQFIERYKVNQRDICLQIVPKIQAEIHK